MKKTTDTLSKVNASVVIYVQLLNL